MTLPLAVRPSKPDVQISATTEWHDNDLAHNEPSQMAVFCMEGVKRCLIGLKGRIYIFRHPRFAVGVSNLLNARQDLGPIMPNLMNGYGLELHLAIGGDARDHRKHSISRKCAFLDKGGGCGGKITRNSASPTPDDVFRTGCAKLSGRAIGGKVALIPFA